MPSYLQWRCLMAYATSDGKPEPEVGLVRDRCISRGWLVPLGPGRHTLTRAGWSALEDNRLAANRRG